MTNTGNVTLTGPSPSTDDQVARHLPGHGGLAPGATIDLHRDLHRRPRPTSTPARSPTPRPPANGASRPSTRRLDTVDRSTPDPALDLDKTATATATPAVGDVIDYTLIVTNTGNVTLTGPFTVTDDRSRTPRRPAPAAWRRARRLTCTATYTVTQADLDAGSVTNTATATNGTDDVAGTDTDDRHRRPEPGPDAGQDAPTRGLRRASATSIDYTFMVTNTGNVTLTGPFTVDRRQGRPVTCPAVAHAWPRAPAVTCTATYTITQADLDAGSVTNHAAHARPADGVTSIDDTATVDAARARR